MINFIKAPLINANEDEMILVEWFREKGSAVRRGELLCVLETAKSTFEVLAEIEGYFYPLVEAGLDVRVGQVIAAISEEMGEEIVLPEEHQPESIDEGERRWTKKAELLAKRHGFDIEVIAEAMSSLDVIGENEIQLFLSGNHDVENLSAERALRKGINSVNKIERVLILGGGNIAVLTLDILSRIPNQHAVGILDDNAALHGKTIMGCKVLGSLDEVVRLWQEDYFDCAALAIGVLPLRAELYEKYTREGVEFGNIIDPTALVSSDVMMGNGNFIMGFCRIGPQAMIGHNNFLSAYVNLEHHNVMGDHCTFGPGVYTSGGVKIGSRVRFGTGIFIEPRLTIGNDVLLASGVILTTNVSDNMTVKSKSNFIISSSK